MFRGYRADMIFEWRRYTLRPGLRDTFVSLFEQHFVESQEEVGIGVAGMFTDLDQPDLIHWMRKFPDMEARRRSLEAFYLHSTAWKTHRDAANATMIDSDDVLLLRPLPVPDQPAPGQGVPDTRAPGQPEGGEPFFELTICHVTPGFRPDFLQKLSPVLAFETEHAENTFPALPVRTVNAVLWLTRTPEAQTPTPRAPDLAPWLTAPVERHRLAPTPCSALR